VTVATGWFGLSESFLPLDRADISHERIRVPFDLRRVSAAVGAAVATAAAQEGLAQVELENLTQQIHDAMWRPEYPDIELKWSGPAHA
jgi:malic enzyme